MRLTLRWYTVQFLHILLYMQYADSWCRHEKQPKTKKDLSRTLSPEQRSQSHSFVDTVAYGLPEALQKAPVELLYLQQLDCGFTQSK